ncbi:MAG: hypothetical protein RIC55_26925 [Pirellulaceae bacterium]
MPSMNGWEIALFAGAAYIAVISLVRLMRRYHERRAGELRRHIDVEKQRQRAQAKKAEKLKQKAEQQASRAA